MEQQPPNPPAQEPQEQPASEQPQSTAAAASQAEAAIDELDERGTALAELLRQVADPHVVEIGGRWEVPWIEVLPANLVEVARRCRDHKDLQMRMLHCLLVVDYVEQLQVVYILLSPSKGHKAMLKVNLPAEAPKTPSVTSLWAGAEWYEREMHDLFGVEFEGISNTEPLVLYEGFEGHPGLKSFPFNEYEEY